MSRSGCAKNIHSATADYEKWLSKHFIVIAEDINTKHVQMSLSAFSFLRRSTTTWHRYGLIKALTLLRPARQWRIPSMQTGMTGAKVEIMATSIFEEIRATTKKVAQSSLYVKINYPVLAKYAAGLPLDQLQKPEHDPSAHYLGHGDDTAAFFVVLDTINFGSGYFPHLRKRTGMSGYFTVASSLKDFYQQHGPLTPAEFAGLTPENCATVFGQDVANSEVMRLMRLFATALNDLGRLLVDSYESSFTNFITASHGFASQLLQQLAVMPFFKDEEEYNGFNVKFYKRAQLMAADLAIAFGGKGLGYFRDMNQLTMFADNLVPHVLRLDGVLTYDAELADRIEKETLIPAGSPEEVEIRACALHTVELLRDMLNGAVTSMQLDYLLWNRGQLPHYKKTLPRHRTRTVFY